MPTSAATASQISWRQLQHTAAQTGINAFYQNTTYANVAFTAAVTASSLPVLLHDPGSVTDGDLHTSWLSDSAATQLLELDLGRPVMLTGYRIAWEGCGRAATSYELQGSLSSQHTPLGALRGAITLGAFSDDGSSPVAVAGREDSALFDTAVTETQIRYVQLVMSSRRNTVHGLCDEYGVREIELFEVSEHADECDGFEFPSFVVDEIDGADSNNGSAVAPFRSAEYATKQLMRLVQQRPACVTADGLEIMFASSSRRRVVVFFGTDSCGQTAVVCLRQPEGPLVCDCGINEAALKAYSKQCATGLVLNGFECEDIDECENTPCFNGAECRDSLSHDYIALGYYQCVCKRGWTGESCVEDVDECTISTPCENGGTCIDGPGSNYTCRCPEGFQGPECRDNYDECLSHPCTNGAHCTNQIDGTGYDCHCVPGYAGDNCEVDVDECGSQPCQNGGVCSSLINSYSCLCVDGGFEGAHCEHRVDRCATRPCENGAVCQSSLTSELGFQCFCTNGYTGYLCSDRVERNMPTTTNYPPTGSPTPAPPPSQPPLPEPAQPCAPASPGMYLCAYGASTTCQYIHLVKVNDGVIDCADGSDETDRGGSSSPQRLPSTPPPPAPQQRRRRTPPPPPPPPTIHNGVAQSSTIGEATESDTVEPVPILPCDPSCNEGEYCDTTFTCYPCDYIDSTRCDFAGGDCCSTEFLQSCPSDPAGCSETSPLAYALVFVGIVGLFVFVIRFVRSRRTGTSTEKQYALVSTGAGDDAWHSSEQATLINGVEARAVSVDRTGTEKHEEAPAQAKSALDLPEILPTDFGSDGEAEQDQFADWLGDASDDDASDSKPPDDARRAEQLGAPRLAFNANSTEEAEDKPEEAAVGTAAERRPLFG